MTTGKRILPAAQSCPEMNAFFEAANLGRLMLPRCRACGKLHWYPRGACPFCLSLDIAWQESPGLGRVYSVTLFARAGDRTAIAYVELDEGLRLLTTVLAEDPASVAIGQRVEVTFKSTDDATGQKYPFFRPIAGKG